LQIFSNKSLATALQINNFIQIAKAANKFDLKVFKILFWCCNQFHEFLLEIRTILQHTFVALIESTRELPALQVAVNSRDVSAVSIGQATCRNSVEKGREEYAQ